LARLALGSAWRLAGLALLRLVPLATLRLRLVTLALGVLAGGVSFSTLHALLRLALS
jgi:hypothetical protein